MEQKELKASTAALREDLEPQKNAAVNVEKFLPDGLSALKSITASSAQWNCPKRRVNQINPHNFAMLCRFVGIDFFAVYGLFSQAL